MIRSFTKCRRRQNASWGRVKKGLLKIRQPFGRHCIDDVRRRQSYLRKVDRARVLSSLYCGVNPLLR